MLTDDEVRYGYWGDKYSRNQDTPPITEVSEYTGQDVLSLSCTQLDPTANQKRIVSEWCDALPHLDGVRTLCFNSRVNQRLFDAASLMPGLEALYVKWGGIKSVASILGNERLRVLTLGSNPGIQDIERLAGMSLLHVLELENVPGAYDLGFVAGLENLELFGLSGSTWTTQSVDSLEPLKNLHNLKSLWLINTKIRNGGLMPLLHVKSLINVRTALFHTAGEFAALRAGLPQLAYGTPFEEETIREYARQ